MKRWEGSWLRICGNRDWGSKNIALVTDLAKMLNWSLNGIDQIKTTTTNTSFKLMPESSEERIILTYNSQVQLHIPCGWVSIIHPTSVNPLVHDCDPEKNKSSSIVVVVDERIVSLLLYHKSCLTVQPVSNPGKEKGSNSSGVWIFYFSKEGWNLKLARVPKPKVGSADQCLAVFWWSTRKISFVVVSCSEQMFF